MRDTERHMARTDLSCSIIILHGIGTRQRTLEPGEDLFWLSKPQFKTVLDMIVEMGAAAPHITFDDGNVSDIEIAFPELEKRNLKATFFLLTSRIGAAGSLTEADVVTLSKGGHRIGLHGHDHVDWRGLDESAQTREFVTARATLSRLTGQRIDIAAAPFGLYNRQTTKNLKSLGFTEFHTSDRGRANDSAFIRPRNCLERSMSATVMQDALRGNVTPARKLRRLVGVARKRFLPLRTIP